MPQNDVVSVEIRFLLLRLLAEISLRIPWETQPNWAASLAESLPIGRGARFREQQPAKATLPLPLATP